MESDAVTESSFVMYWNTARAKHPYSDSGFVKKNVAEVVTVLEPNNKRLQRLIEKYNLHAKLCKGTCPRSVPMLKLLFKMI